MTQRLFPDFGSESLREARLIFMVEISGEARRLDLEKRGPGFAEAKKTLQDAATTLNNKKVNEMLAHEETLDMIASQVELLAGNDSKKWLNAIALSFLQKSGEIFTGEGQAINAAKDKSTNLSKECAKILKATIDDLRKLQKAYSDAGGEGDFPGFDTSVRGILEKKTNVDTFKKRFDQLVDLMKDILWASDDDLKDTKKWTDKFKTAGIPETSLTPFVTASESTARRTALLKIIRETGGIELLTADERTKLEAAMQAMETQLSQVDRKIQDHIQTRFAARVRYLDRLGGSDAGALIALSINDDGMLATDFLMKRCGIILNRKDNQLTPEEQNKLKASLNPANPELKKPDSPEMKELERQYPGITAKLKPLLTELLTKGWAEYIKKVDASGLPDATKAALKDGAKQTEIIAALLSGWDTTKTREYLERTLGVRNPPGVSLPAERLRARMPDEVVGMLERGNYRPSPGLLISIAKLKNFGMKMEKKEIKLGDAKAEEKLQMVWKEYPWKAPRTGSAMWMKADDFKKLLTDLPLKGGAAAADATITALTPKLDLKTENEAGVLYFYFDISKKAAAIHEVGLLKVEVDEMVEGTTLGTDSATEIVELVTEKAGTGEDKLKSRAALLDYIIFLKYKDSETQAAADAEVYLKTIEGDGKPITKKSDKFYTVDKANLVVELSKLNVPKEGTPRKIYNKMVERKIHLDPTWREVAGMHASEYWELVKAGSGAWGAYIAALPREIWDPKHDADLLKLLNQRAALRDGHASLEKLLKTSSGAQKFLETTETGLHSRRESQLKALRGDPAVSPLEHNEQARALLMANQYVIGQLNTMGWNTCSRRLRQLTLWMAMHKGTPKDPEAGLKEARQLLQAAGKLRTPEEQDTFVDEQMEAMNARDKQAFLRSTDARAIVETQAGRDILSPFKQRGLNLKPGALDLLRQAKDPVNPALNLAANVGRWTMDPPEKVADALAIALEDSPAKEAYVEAFVSGEDQTYVYQGRTEKVSVIDARLAVNALQQRLLFEMRGSIKAKEQIEDENEFTNPVDRWLRTGIESMKDLWNTDMVGKAEVIAIAFAAYWMIKEAWKNKKGKFVLLGLPILLGVNAIVKQRTGRDLLGENLRFKNKEDRTSPLEAFRRRGAALDKRYEVLMHPSGQAAIRVLMNEKNPIAVQELLAWRHAVKSGGGKKYSLGVPGSLSVSDIEDNLGAAGSREKACEVAYLAFEALCADVARVNGLSGGNTDTNAEQGADLIQRRYVQNRSGALKPVTMFDVIMSECQMPTKEMLENRSYLEAAADLFGYTYDEAKALVKEYGTQAWVMMKQGVHKVPEVAGTAVDYAGEKWDGFRNWAALTWAKGKPEMEESIKAVWRFLSTTAAAGGVWLKDITPTTAEWVINTSVVGVGKTKDVFWNVLGMLMKNGITGPAMESLLAAGKRILDLDIKPEWLTPEYREKRADGDQFMRDVMGQVAACAALPSIDVDPADAAGIPEKYFKMLLGPDGNAADAPTRMIAMEMAKRKIFSFLAAERIHALSKKMNKTPPDTTPLVLPLRPNWPSTIPEFNSLQERDPVYAHLFNQYDLRTMLAAIGDQQTIIGLMRLVGETAPSTFLGSVSNLLLWPGLEQYFTRDSAGTFLVNGAEPLYEIREYAGEILTQAQKQLNPDEYAAFSAYVHTLLTNVMVETILSNGRSVTDLRLLKKQAKDFRLHLLEKRGLLATHSDMEKWNVKAKLSPFNQSAKNSAVPDELLNLECDAHFRWLLLGEEEPHIRSAGQVPSAAPGAAPGTAPAQRPMDADDVRRYPTMLPNTPEAIEELLNEALGRVGLNGAQETAIRQKFDALPPAPFNPNDLATAACEKSLQRYLGVTEAEAEKIGKDLLQQCNAIGNDPGKRFAFANWLSNSIGSMRSRYPNHSRFQRLLDQATMILLDQIVQEVGSVPKADLSTHPNYRNWEATLVELYRATSQQPDKYTDVVSQLLEYVLYRGDHGAPVNGKKNFEKYREYLKSKNLPESKYLVNQPWFSSIQSESEGRLGSNFNWNETYVKGWYGMGGQVGAKATALLKEAESRPWK